MSTTNATPAPSLPPAALLNRTAIALARSRRLIDSWLPVPSASNTSTPGTITPTLESDAQSDDIEDLKNLPDFERRAGLGAVPIGVKGSAGGGGSSELEALRKRLLGTKGAKASLAANASASASASVGRGGTFVGGKRGAQRQAEEESDSEEEGRASAVGGRKKGGVVKREKKQARKEVEKDEQLAKEIDGAAGDDVVRLEDTILATSTEALSKQETKKRPASYLDELLGERSKKKKKKKKNKNKNKGNDEGDAGKNV